MHNAVSTAIFKISTKYPIIFFFEKGGGFWILESGQPTETLAVLSTLPTQLIRFPDNSSEVYKFVSTGEVLLRHIFLHASLRDLFSPSDP